MGPPPGSVTNKTTRTKSMISETGSTNFFRSPSSQKREGEKTQSSSDHIVHEDGYGDEDQASFEDSWKENTDTVNILVDDELLFDTPAPVEAFVSLRHDVLLLGISKYGCGG
jgi:hypothetical protein